MTSAVLDTTTLVSGLGWAGVPAEVVDLGIAGRFTMISTRPLLKELGRVLRYPKISAHIANPERLLLLIEAVSVVVEPKESFALLDDEPDNRLLEAAQEADADYIVTGDREVLGLERFENSQVVSPRQFLEELGSV